ncbi:retrotransposon protein, putative, ty3-gypsy subclass [Tanacetum coccineum]
MTTVNQGMSVEEIERVVAQRVANAIEAIAIYETKTNMARKVISRRTTRMHGHEEKKYYSGSKLLCPKCNYHDDGLCAPKCHRGEPSQKVNCYECGNQGHYRRDCPERKNQSHKNQIGGTGAHGVVHTLRGEETDQDPNNIKDEIKA